MYFLYFDPSVGAMIVQAIVATVAGFILFSKNLMYKIKTFFGLYKHQDDLYEDINVDDSDVDKK
tara:strand:- start:44513 stop:44704 length:192 start_codon:yes stop_codon:yes gene_type:complete